MSFLKTLQFSHLKKNIYYTYIFLHLLTFLCSFLGYERKTKVIPYLATFPYRWKHTGSYMMCHGSFIPIDKPSVVWRWSWPCMDGNGGELFNICTRRKIMSLQLREVAEHVHMTGNIQSVNSTQTETVLCLRCKQQTWFGLYLFSITPNLH
jgi:hypothetical protein